MPVVLLQLRRHFTEMLLDQVPPLVELQRAVDMMTVTDTPSSNEKPALLLETVRVSDAHSPRAVCLNV